MHGELFAELLEFRGIAFRFKRDENADLAEAWFHRTVHVSRDNALAHFKGRHTAQGHVLADGGDGIRDRFRNSLVGRGHFLGFQRFDIAAGSECFVGDFMREGLELVVTGNKVRLRVEFDDRSAGAIAGNGDKAFRSDTAGFLGSL